MRTPQELAQLKERAVMLRRQGNSRRQIKQAHEASRAAVRAAAVAEIGDLTDRELVIAGAIAYWCEGSKNKLGPPNDRVVFTNSDPALVRFFLRFLEVTGTPRTDAIFRVCIHESADVGSAQRFWLEVTGASPDQFRRPTLKRHNPKTVRKNVGEGYYGCLRIDVRRSGGLYRTIEAWAAGIMSVSSRQNRKTPNSLCAPGEGFEPPLTGPKPVVLPG
jgi:hypothetical protein